MLAPFQPPDRVLVADVEAAVGRPITAPWLVLVLTSATCDSCHDVVAKAEPLRSTEVAVIELSVQAHPDFHRAYSIDAVPLTLIADSDGWVRHTFTGPVSATHLWAAVAEVREPGSTPGPCDH